MFRLPDTIPWGSALVVIAGALWIAYLYVRWMNSET